MPMLVVENVHSGAETLTNQCSGTSVQQVGASGSVIAAYISGDGTSSASLTAAAANGSQIAIIPDGSNAINATELKASDHFVYRASGLQPGSALLLTIVAASASTSVWAIRTY